jgi:hypothetical protein
VDVFEASFLGCLKSFATGNDTDRNLIILSILDVVLEFKLSDRFLRS